MKGRDMATELIAIDRGQIRPLDKCEKIRWLGPNGGWRKGVLVRSAMDGVRTALDLHRMEVVSLAGTQFEYDLPKDDDGHPVNNDIQAR